jgi:hypothetical protein
LHLELHEHAIRDSSSDVYNTRIKIYALSYNLLRIMSGMGGLATQTFFS